MTDPTDAPDTPEATRPTLLKALLRQRRWQTYKRFRREYNRAAATVDRELVGTYPSDAQYRRWINGRIGGVPRSEPCAVLEAMFPGYTVEQLFEPYQDGRSAEHRETNTEVLTSADSPPVGGHHSANSDTSNGSESEVKDVNRRQLFNTAATFAPALILPASVPVRVDMGDVDQYKQDMEYLRALDHASGSSEKVYHLAEHSLGHLVRIMETASYTPGVGNQLRSIAGELMALAGWLSFDAGRYRDAHSWYLKAQHAARISDDTDTEVYALNAMSLAADHEGRGRDAVDLAQAASRIARRSRPTPRLLSLLAAREACGHAHNGDSAATWRAFGRAEADLDRGQHDDDPAWLTFWRPASLATQGRRAAYCLGDLDEAELQAREALAAGDQKHYRRNYTIYQANLAIVLTARGNVDEAVPAITSAAKEATQISSVRLTTKVRSAVRDLNAHHGEMPAVRELTEWTTTNLPAPVRDTSA